MADSLRSPNLVRSFNTTIPPEDPMRSAFLILLLSLLLPSATLAQATPDRAPGTSRVTTLVGMGNSFGGLGVLADIKAFGNGPVSLMIGAGTTRAFFGGPGLPNDWTDEQIASVAGAIGLRGNVGQGRHQGFLEFALLPVDDDVVRITDARQRLQMLYGLGLQLGYRVRMMNGITLNVMGGAGYALNNDVIASRWKPVFGAGLGYAWPRR
jgi:hypothetical protein